MHAFFLQAFFILVLSVLVRHTDLMISAIAAKNPIRALAYGIVAILAFFYIAIVLVLSLQH